MINIVHDNLPNSNVWFAPRTRSHSLSSTWTFRNRDLSARHNKPIPWFIHLADNLTFHSSAEGLDSFIYPIVMHEPYIQVRSLISNHNDYGFWSYVSDDVIKGLKEKRGWIIIDLNSEPISRFDFDCIIDSLVDCSNFPNDRVLINTVSPHFVVNDRVFFYPSRLEMGCIVNQIQETPDPCPCKPITGPDVSYPHKRFLLLNNHIDYDAANLFAKYANENPDSFLDSSGTVPGKTDLHLPQAIHATDFNVVLEAYTDYDVIEYPYLTEKIYRNIRYKKPFILMGQQYTLASFHKLGYKTFHPIINESYDSIKYTKDRCKAVLKELQRLRHMSDAEFTRLLDKCKPILEHNYNNLMSRINQTNDWLEGLKHL